MRPVGSRKDHTFDSDGKLKVSRGRAHNEDKKIIKDQLKEIDISETEKTEKDKD